MPAFGRDKTEQLRDKANIDRANATERRRLNTAKLEALDAELVFARSDAWAQCLKLRVAPRMNKILIARMATNPKDDVQNASIYGQYLERQDDMNYLEDLEVQAEALRKQIAADSEKITILQNHA